MKKGFLAGLQSAIWKNKATSSIILLFLFCSLFYLFFPLYYSLLLKIYMLSLLRGASILLTAFQITHSFDSSSQRFVFDSFAYIPDTQFAALKYMFIAVFIPIFFLKLSNKRMVMFVIFAAVLLFCLNCFRVFLVLRYCSIHSHIPGINHNFLFVAFLFIFPILTQIWNRGGRVWPIFRESNNMPSKLLQKHNINRVLLGFSISFFILSFPDVTNWLLNGLTFIIFSLSKLILSQFSIFVTFRNRLLVDANNSIFMGDPCVGLNIMIVFAIVVLLSMGKKLQKFLFILFGLLFIIFLNAIRVSLLFAYLDETGVSNLVIDHWHAIYNNVIYISVFILWVAWFQLQKYLNNEKTRNSEPI